jgi:hypothetical protein
MKVNVKLYGTLRRRFPGYQHAHGIELEIPDGTTAQDLFKLLNISESHQPVIVMKGRILRSDDKILYRAAVNIFQSLQGG